MDSEEKIGCPYGAGECPKVNELKEELKALNWKLNALIMIIVLLHGAELVALIK